MTRVAARPVGVLWLLQPAQEPVLVVARSRRRPGRIDEDGGKPVPVVARVAGLVPVRVAHGGERSVLVPGGSRRVPERVGRLHEVPARVVGERPAVVVRGGGGRRPLRVRLRDELAHVRLRAALAPAAGRVVCVRRDVLVLELRVVSELVFLVRQEAVVVVGVLGEVAGRLDDASHVAIAAPDEARPLALRIRDLRRLPVRVEGVRRPARERGGDDRRPRSRVVGEACLLVGSVLRGLRASRPPRRRARCRFRAGRRRRSGGRSPSRRRR